MAANGRPPEPAETSPGIPGAGPDGFFGVRFESIGGLGAHLAGQILAEAGVLGCGLNGSHFSSYGSEKKGSPVRSFVRLCAAAGEIRRSDPIERPQVVVVFHRALVGSPGVLAGLGPEGTIVVNTPSDPGATRERLGLRAGTVAVVDGLQIAVEESTRVNSAMLGAAARFCPCLEPDVIRDTLAARLGRRYPQLVEANLRTFDRGYAEVRHETYAATGDEPLPEPDRPPPSYGYLEAPIGGTILEPASSVVRDLSISREGFLPALELEKCVHCGLCDIVCPDLCFVWEVEPDEAVRLRGIDYRYCKGCRKCTEVCPTGALTEIREEEGWADAHRVPLYPELERTG
ncbi:MAG TPA: 2-oxoacid:acceptor oxidoreductase family protein [Gaiellaceae bacterium]|nr:2-oxoacid:acceptor oxidoreductase family protein [Gaiellaceae bacterium]